MIAFIALFLPAVLSVWIFEALRKESLGWKNWLYRFSLNTLLINWIIFAVKKVILGTAASVISGFATDMSPDIAFNYLVMAVPLAIVLGVVSALLKKHVRIETEDSDDK